MWLYVQCYGVHTLLCKGSDKERLIVKTILERSRSGRSEIWINTTLLSIQIMILQKVLDRSFCKILYC